MKRRTHVIHVLFPDMKVIRKKLSGTALPKFMSLIKHLLFNSAVALLDIF